MIGAEKLRIQIIDIFLNEDNVIFEKTQYQNPTLKYNGDEDKFNNLHTTELSFNCLVNTNEEAVFFHLFTADDNRFKVVLDDVTDADNIKGLWSGFLLPEQFNEPFVFSDYFVNFLATDGIGNLKNKFLNSNYYSQQKSVLDIIFNCLLKTGLELPMLFAPAIENAGFDLSYKDLEIPTECYNEDDQLDAYSILNKCVEAIGCKLFQYENQWILVGINRVNHVTIEFQKFEVSAALEMQYVENVIIDRNIIEKPFLANPTITVIPELRGVKTSFENKNSEFLIPEDVVTHMPVNFATDVNDRTLKYWSLQSTKNFVFNVWYLGLSADFDYSQINQNTYFNGFIAVPGSDEKVENNGPFLLFNPINETIVLEDLDTNYGYLTDAFFVDGSEDLERVATLDIECLLFKAAGVTDTQIRDAIEDELLNGLFYFAITYKRYKNQPIAEEEIYLSNFADDKVPDGFYDFEVDAEDPGVKAVLKLEKLLLTKTGYYNVRLYPALTHEFFTGVQVYKQLDFKITTPETDIVEINKNVNYSSYLEKEFYHTDAESALSNRSFVFSDALKQQAADGLLFPSQIEVVPVSYSNTPVNTNGNLWYNLIVVVITKEDFTKIQNGYSVFVQKNGAGAIVELAPGSFTVANNATIGGYTITQFNFVAAPTPIIIEQSDKIFLKINTDSTNAINYAEHWLRRWKRFGVDESDTFLSLLNKIYHSCLSEYNYSVNGEFGALVTPFDLIDFKYKGNRRYNPVSATLNLHKGTTSLYMVESKYKDIFIDDVTVDEVVDVVEEVDPSISIRSEAVAPSIFNVTWTISTAYEIAGFNNPNVLLTAKQFTDSMANNGVATGYEKTAALTSAEGLHAFLFNILQLDAERGWYQLQAKQDGVVSNVQEVLVAPQPAVETETIEIAKIYIGDVLNATGRYSIKYNGFTPTVAKQILQKVDSITSLPIGNATETTIDETATEVNITFPSSGSWQITIEANNKTSNKIAWLSIQF